MHAVADNFCTAAQLCSCVHILSRTPPWLLGLQAIASEVINPDSIDVTLSDIGGLDSIIDSLVSARTGILHELLSYQS